MALAQVGSAAGGRRVIVALEDRLLRENLSMALAAEGLQITECISTETALSLVAGGAVPAALIVDGSLPDGEETPRARLVAARCLSPVYVLCAPGEASEAAERWGAVGVVDRALPIATLSQSLVNAIRLGDFLAEPGRGGISGSYGFLSFGDGGRRVMWKGSLLDLSESERALLSGLMASPDEGLTYQKANAILKELDGSEAARDPDRVKSLVRRLRKKFREVDPDFDQIVLVPGRGYSWREMPIGADNGPR